MILPLPATASVPNRDWLSALESLPRRLPDSAWTGHIPFLFLLFSLLRPKVFVELGVHLGASFLAACDAAKSFDLHTRCYGIDTWQGDAHAGFYEGDQIFAELNDYVAGKHRRCELIRATFDDALARFSDHSIDLLHIDGLHTYEAVRHDFETWRPKLSRNSVVLFHDIAVRQGDFGVWKLWDELKGSMRSFEFEHSFGLGVLVLGDEFPRGFSELLSLLQADRGRLAQLQSACEQAARSMVARFNAREARRAARR